MYKQCKTIQSSERQYKIGESLITLMKKEPYSKITISTLCRENNISRTIFYRYFDTKEDVFLFLIDHLMYEHEQFDLKRPQPDRRTLQWDIEGFFLFWYSKREMLRVIIDNNLTDILFEQLISRGRRERAGAALMPLDDEQYMQPLVLTFSFYGLVSLLLEWNRQDYKTSPKVMAEASVRLLTKPLYRLFA